MKKNSAAKVYNVQKKFGKIYKFSQTFFLRQYYKSTSR